MKKELLNAAALERSSVVANSLMNRERSCRKAGGNSYQKELSFDIPEFLKTRLRSGKKASWLDICCGSGKALIEAANIFASQKLNSEVEITGVDLVSMFEPFDPKPDFLNLVEASIEKWQPDGEFDLITCVHGLHYIGDKLGLIRKAASWLKNDGVFLANLDLENFRFADGKSAGRTVAGFLRRHGFEYKSARRLIVCHGKKEFKFKPEYLGADDQAGANYTGQSAVNSFYAKFSEAAENPEISKN